MTFRDILSILRQRWLTVLATTLIVAGAAGGYAMLAPQSYESTTVLRFSVPASQSLRAAEGGYPGLELDLDTFFVTSEEVLTPVAAAAGETASTLRESAQVELLEGSRTLRLQITSAAEDPQQAQSRADSIANAYIAHLQAQFDEHQDELAAQFEEAEDDRDEALQAAGQDFDDLYAQQQLAQALTAHLDLERQVAMLEQAEAPALLMEEASPGRLVGSEPASVLLVGLISGLIAGAGMALLRDQFDDRIRQVKAVEEYADHPLLAEVPVLRRRKRDVSLPLAEAVPSPFNESIRSLRTSLQVVYSEQAVIVLTSPSPGDGKSFLIANLAVSMARSGRKVLLINGDMRRPRLGCYFGVEQEQQGLADLLEQGLSAQRIEELLVPTEFENLCLLPSGIAESQPADLLAGERLPRLVSEMKRMADVVLIDAPPGLAITDAALLGKHADGVAVVFSVGRTKKQDLEAMLHGLGASGVPLAGMVANRSRRKLHRSYTTYYKISAAKRPANR